MTPKTDAAVAHGYRFTTDTGTKEYVPADFARDLERENMKLREALLGLLTAIESDKRVSRGDYLRARQVARLALKP